MDRLRERKHPNSQTENRRYNTSWQKEKIMKLLQLNIFLRPPPVNSLGGEHKDTRMEHFVRDFLRRFDLVCLQECFGTLNSRRDRLMWLAGKQGFQGQCFSPRGCIMSCNGNLKLIDGGLVILSRKPMTYSEFHPFSAGCDVDKLARKGVLYARIDLERPDGRQLHVFTTHTQASYNFAANEASLQVKYDQLKEMKEFILDMTRDYPATWPVIVTGDFNMDSLQEKCPEYEFCTNALAECSRTVEGQKAPTRFVDVMHQNYQRFVPTTVPFEWRANTGLAIRSSLLTKDLVYFEEHRSEVQLVSSGDIKGIRAKIVRVENEGLTNSTSFVGTESTFWADQCLDYVFFEQGNGLQVNEAYIDTLRCDRDVLPYSQISDHHGLCVHFSVV